MSAADLMILWELQKLAFQGFLVATVLFVIAFCMSWVAWTLLGQVEKLFGLLWRLR